jgi:hypothetical protein
MPLVTILTSFRPESWGGTRGETWAEHYCYLRAEDPGYLARMRAHMLAVGGWFGPPVLVDGDVVQDRHHGLVVAMELGWHDLPIPVKNASSVP